MVLGIAFLPTVVLRGLWGKGARRKFPLLLLRGLAAAVPNMEKESSNQLSQLSQWSGFEAQRGNEPHSGLSRKYLATGLRVFFVCLFVFTED